MSYDLLHACEISEEEFQQFQEERLQSSPPKKKFHEPVKLNNNNKKKAVSTQGRAMMLKADRSLFGRMIITGQSRKIEVKTCCNIALGTDDSRGFSSEDP